MTASDKVDVVPLSTRYIEPYLRFAAREFGAHAYQAKRSFLSWLYEERPSAEGIEDAQIAVCGEDVVGCFHKMRLPWSIGGEPYVVAAPNSLHVAPAYRKGVGFALIAESFKAERLLYLVGAGAAVAPIYERMGARRVRAMWFRGLLNPLSAPLVIALRSLSARRLDDALGCAWARFPSGRASEWVDVRTRLDDEELSAVAEALVRHAGEATHVAWTPRLVQWRFFAPAGPRHVLIRLGSRRDRGTRALAIVSLGVQRSLLVARVVEWYADGDGTALLLGLGLRAALAAAGVNVWFAMTTDATKARQWRTVGLREVSSPPAVYELTKPRSRSLGPVLVQGGAGDYGWEALPIGAQGLTPP